MKTEKDKLLRDIRKEIKRGYPAEELKNQLIETGLNPQEVNAILNSCQRKSNSPTNKRFVQKSNPANQLIAACSIITGVAILSVFSSAGLGWLLVVAGTILLMPSLKNFIKNSNARD